MTNNKATIGSISGIPIVMDYSLIALILVFAMPHMRGGPVSMVCGACIVAGVIGSILVHELAHGWAGRFTGREPEYIELHGFGGQCVFGPKPASRAEDMFVTLAGPLSNLALWALFYWLGEWILWGAFELAGEEDENAQSTIWHAASSLYIITSTLARLNIAMFIFNLMPSFPLDGGHALTAYLSKRYGTAEAVKTVAALGYIVCAGCVWVALKGNAFMFVVAISLFMSNNAFAETYGRQTWKRWN